MDDLQAAAVFVDRAGLALVFPSDESVLPSLWEAVIGTSELRVFEVDETGKRGLSGELELVWWLHDRLAAERLACVGKHLHNRLSLLSLRLLPACYALTGRSGRPDDFRAPDLLPPLERKLADALLEHGPRTGPELRHLLGLRDPRTTKRALESLQRRLVITRAGEVEQARGWSAARFDLVARYFGDRLGELPDLEAARLAIAGAMLRTAGELGAGDLAGVLGCTRREAAATLGRLRAAGPIAPLSTL
jgi:hypothetical protein